MFPELGQQVRCQLLGELNPALCEAVLRSLPIFSVQTHAVVAGKQIYFPTRLSLEDPNAARSEDMSRQPPGRINFEPFFQYISLNYGPVSEAVPAWPIAQVVEADLPLLPKLGELIWHNLLHGADTLHVILSRAGLSASVPDAGRRQHVAPTEGMNPRSLTELIVSETERIWLHEPQDSRELRTGRSNTEAGVAGQYFSPWVMVTGLIRGLSVVDVAALKRLSANGKMTPQQLAELLSELLLVTAGVTSYFGLPELGGMLKAVRASCPRFTDAAELGAFLSAFSTYLNRYNLWLHQGFPWRLGEQFTRNVEGDPSAGAGK